MGSRSGAAALQKQSLLCVIVGESPHCAAESKEVDRTGCLREVCGEEIDKSTT